MKKEDNSPDKVLYTGISCHKTYSSRYGSLLTCFVINQQEISFLAVNFYNESPYTVYYSDNMIKTEGSRIINCVVSPDKSKCLCGYIDFSSYYHFLIYDIEKNSFSTTCKLMVGCAEYKYYTGIKYIKEQNEYIGYCFSLSGKLIMIKFDENFNVKDIDDNNHKSYINLEYKSDFSSIYSSSLIYDSNKEIYSLVFSGNKYEEDTFNLFEINENQVTKVPIEENCNFYETKNLVSTSSLIETIAKETSKLTIIPTTTLTSTPTPTLTSILTSISLSTLISTSSFASTTTLTSSLTSTSISTSTLISTLITTTSLSPTTKSTSSLASTLISTLITTSSLAPTTISTSSLASTAISTLTSALTFTLKSTSINTMKKETIPQIWEKIKKRPLRVPSPGRPWKIYR
mgnify:CR=1 FL=1